MKYDVAIVGGGPAGASCAAFCAQIGLLVVVIERERFPREKVCGDCINPSCWPVLHRLQLDDALRHLPHGVLDYVEFVDTRGHRLQVPLACGADGEIAVKRSEFDTLLLNRARELGAEVHEKTFVREIVKVGDGWRLYTNVDQEIQSRILVAADGRNSSVARLLGLLPTVTRERVALQAHVPLPDGFGNKVVLQLLPHGYSGQAPVNRTQLNVCLVGRAKILPRLREWASAVFNLAADQTWRTITPLSRRSIAPVHNNLFLIGDVARVVEPFTGEGISYALNSGEIAANVISRLLGGEKAFVAGEQYRRAYRAMYRGRLWINALTRSAVTSPKAGEMLFELARWQPALLRYLTRKIVR